MDYTNSDKLKFLDIAKDQGDVIAARLAEVATRTLRRWRAKLSPPEDRQRTPLRTPEDNPASTPMNTKGKAQQGPAQQGQRTPEEAEDRQRTPQRTPEDTGAELQVLDPALRTLKPRELAFVLAYTGQTFGHRANSAREAGYTGGWNTLSSAAYRLMQKDKVKAAIEHVMARYVMSKVEAQSRLSDMATSNMGDFLSLNDSDRPLIDLQKAASRGALRHVKKVKCKTLYIKNNEDGTETSEVISVEVELYDAQSALDKVMRSYGGYLDKVEHTVAPDYRVTIGGMKKEEPGDKQEDEAILEAELVE